MSLYNPIQIPLVLTLLCGGVFYFFLLWQLATTWKGVNPTYRLHILTVSIACGVTLFLFSATTAPFAVSDSFEYVAGAKALGTGQPYHFYLDNQSHPFRFPPWYSLFVLSPVVSALSIEIAAKFVSSLILSCLVFQVLIYFETQKLLVVCFPLICLLLIPDFSIFFFSATTEGVSTLLMLFLARPIAQRVMSKRANNGSGCVTAVFISTLLIILFKPALFWMPLLFIAGLYKRFYDKSDIYSALFATLFAVIVHSAYNFLTFNDWQFTGYHYWLPIPYWWSELTFSWRYFLDNFISYFSYPSIQLISFLTLYLLTHKFKGRGFVHEQSLYIHSTIICWVSIVIFSFYFYQSVRLLSPILFLFVYLCSYLIPSRHYNFYLKGLFLSVLFCLILSPIQRMSDVDEYKIAAEIRTHNTRTLLISDLNPLGLQLMSRSSTYTADMKRDLEIIPLSRQAEYASKKIALQVKEVRQGLPPPTLDPFKHRHPALSQYRVGEAYSTTFIDNPESFYAQIRSFRGGSYVYTHDTMLLSKIRDMLRQINFSLSPTKLSGLYKLEMKSKRREEALLNYLQGGV